MKNYKQLLESLPSKTIVFAFVRVNPPHIGHELLVQFVKKLALKNNSDHIIYVSRTQDVKKNPLSVDQKLHYLKLMFPGINFVGANDQQRTFMEVAKALNQKYKNIIMVGGADRVPEFKRLLEKYNGKDFHFDSIQVLSAGDRDPDSDDVVGMSATKMRDAASKGDFNTFRKGIPSSMRDIDVKRLMNDVRTGMKLDPIKEHFKLSTDQIREKYYNKKILNVGDIVESFSGQEFRVLKRCTNHVLCEDENGNIHNKWIYEIHIKD
jgi:nicotinic acid mononucleotide adenylyltransferase